MGTLQFEYIKDAMRMKGFIVTQETNRREICSLLGKDLKTPMRDLSEELGIKYKKRNCEWGERKNIFLHYYDKTSVMFYSMSSLQSFLGVNILGGFKYIIHTTISFKGKRCYISFDPENISKKKDFQELSPCKSNKTNICLKMIEIGYKIDIGISLKEITKILDVHFTKENITRKICDHLKIEYYTAEGDFYYRERVKILAILENSTENSSTLEFGRMIDVAKHFETNICRIIESIKYCIPFPFHGVKWTLVRKV